MLVLFSLLSGAFSLAQQDTDGSLERLSQSISSHQQVQLQSLLDGVEHLEAVIGREQVASLYVESVARAVQSAVNNLAERFKGLNSDQAGDLFSELKNLYSEKGTPQLQRVVRNVERRTRDPRDRLVAVFSGLAQFSQIQGLQRLIADHGGAVSKVLRSALHQARNSNHYTFGSPFLLTRIWTSVFDSYGIDAVEAFFLGLASLIVVPLTLAGDLALLPFQALYWVASFVNDIFTTTPEERRSEANQQQAVIDRLREELHAQSVEIVELRERLRQASELSRDQGPGTIRR